jgi:hypothetical protein
VTSFEVVTAKPVPDEISAKQGVAVNIAEASTMILRMQTKECFVPLGTSVQIDGLKIFLW